MSKIFKKSKNIIKVSVPGSLMLFGEHAVLHGKCAIVTAIDKYITITLSMRDDNKIAINSAEFAKCLMSIDKFKITKPYDYVLTAIKTYLKKLPCGFNLDIESDFSATMGFGSSAAVTVATLSVLSVWLDKKINLMNLHKKAHEVIKAVSGVGSGADLAASIFGGVIAYKMQPRKIQKISDYLPLVAIYSGSKTPTHTVIAVVEKKRKQFKKIYNNLYNLIDSCTKEAILAIKKNDLSRVGQLMNIHHGLQDALGVNNEALSKLAFYLRAQKKIYGAKISGAGLGDCVVGLGKI
ncbi:MAG: hypothetical protein ACD_82C00119G0001 [uncultured bacterium]|nr:MAG: hypothetical protein ACD_82C00119G0001 [uncultured bacterium]